MHYVCVNVCLRACGYAHLCSRQRALGSVTCRRSSGHHTNYHRIIAQTILRFQTPWLAFDNNSHRIVFEKFKLAIIIFLCGRRRSHAAKRTPAFGCREPFKFRNFRHGPVRHSSIGRGQQLYRYASVRHNFVQTGWINNNNNYYY